MKEKCIICKKKLTLTDMKCRCGVKLCTKHRLPEQHQCSYNFKKDQPDQKKLGLGGGQFVKIIKI